MGHSNQFLVKACAAAAIVAAMVTYAGSKGPSKTIISAKFPVEKLRSRIVPIQGFIEEKNTYFTGGSGALVRMPTGGTGIITNEHVCRGLTQYFPKPVTHVDGAAIKDLFIVKQDRKVDLCLLLSPRLLWHENFAVKAINAYYPGEGLLIIGYPLNGPLAPQMGFYINQAPTMVVEEAKNGECDGELIPCMLGMLCGVTQTLNAMTNLTYPGNSGSPVFDENLDLVGIANSGNTSTNQGNFISGATVANFLKEF